MNQAGHKDDIEEIYQELLKILPNDICTLDDGKIKVNMAGPFTVEKDGIFYLVRCGVGRLYQHERYNSCDVIYFFEELLKDFGTAKAIVNNLASLLNFFNLTAKIRYSYALQINFNFGKRVFNILPGIGSIHIFNNEVVTKIQYLLSPGLYNYPVKNELIKIISTDIQIATDYLEKEYIIYDYDSHLLAEVCQIINQQTQLLIDR